MTEEESTKNDWKICCKNEAPLPQTHLNFLHLSIQIMHKKESSCSLPFLDVFVDRQAESFIKNQPLPANIYIGILSIPKNAKLT